MSHLDLTNAPITLARILKELGLIKNHENPQSLIGRTIVFEQTDEIRWNRYDSTKKCPVAISHYSTITGLSLKETYVKSVAHVSLHLIISTALIDTNGHPIVFDLYIGSVTDSTQPSTTADTEACQAVTPNTTIRGRITVRY